MAYDELYGRTVPRRYLSFSDLFRTLEFDKLPPSRDFDHKIFLIPDHNLKEIEEETYTEYKTDLIEDFVDDLLSRKIITPSKSIAASKIIFETIDKHLVPRVSFSQLNKVTEKHNFSFQSPLNIIRSIGKATVFTKLVIQDVYKQILMHKHHMYRTTFSTPFGKFKSITLPFHLTNATATIQEMVEEILDIPNKEYVVAYLDNILVFSRKSSKHAGHVKDILECLRDNAILLDINRCELSHEFAIPWISA